MKVMGRNICTSDVQRRCIPFFAFIVFAACALLQRNASDPDQKSLINSLQHAGVAVERGGIVRQSFLHTQGTRFCLSGPTIDHPTPIHVYLYQDAQVALADAQQIRPDGGQVAHKTPNGGGEGSTIDWIAPPHFFHHNRLVVLYLGSDAAVLDLLSNALGPQFAGASADVEWSVRSEAC